MKFACTTKQKKLQYTHDSRENHHAINSLYQEKKKEIYKLLIRFTCKTFPEEVDSAKTNELLLLKINQ